MFGWGKPGGRMEILRHVFERLGEPANTLDARVAEAAQAFDNYVQAKIFEAGMVPGAMEMLKDISKRGISMYLNSGTATAALVLSARNLQIHHFFNGILGSTKEPIGGSKVHNLGFMKQQELVETDEILFVGDGDSDLKAAQEFGCRFVGVSNRWNNWKKEEKSFPLVTNLQDVANYL
jgi:phosphoglycolate phosphatase-like HAD superfamily hydrolase